ncbi:cytochrome P450 6B5-like [Bicyclus anynana]|uniref:unspecific monooxygenase n=1 Tax=Bicyclus anynana TaxID=110368 RepID=A0A6J1NS66_BICAN|nr:cytochrome P450 6B5-like [Bicyclus anynana]
MITFFLLFVLILVFYYYGTRNFDYWKKRGVKYEEPLFFFGGNIKFYIDNVSFSERFAALHRAYPNEKFVGFFEGNGPAILFRDPDLIKHVLVTDFRYFHRRGVSLTKNVTEPLMKNLFTVDGDIWKLMRQKLTPAFSTSKLKAMFPLIIETTEKLTRIANDLAETKDEVDVRELMARFTTDFVGACGFGIDSQALNEEDSDFRQLGKRIFNPTTRDHFVNLIKGMFPDTFSEVRFFAPEIEEKTFSIVKRIMSQRNYKPCGRNDFIDMMLELRLKGKIVGESIERRNADGTPEIVELEQDDKLLAAQVFIFFAAGFETSSSASSFLLHMLAYHPEVQDRCRKEVDAILEKYDGRLCYDAVKEFKYLLMAFKEALRLLPSPGFLLRLTCDKYHIPGTDVSIDEGTTVVISLEALFSDERFFKDPEKFDPERFHPHKIGELDKSIYMPFGDGPRACIGERMGIMQSLAGVATILKNFTVTPSRSSLRKPRIDPKSIIVQSIIGGLPLSLKRRQKT